MRFELFVMGRPVPMPKFTGKTKWKYVDHPVWGWRDRVAYAVKGLRQDDWPLKVPVGLGMDYTLHPRQGCVPDLTNLNKAVEDCLSGVLYVDDVQVREHLSPTRRNVVFKRDKPEGLALIIAYGEELP